MTQKLKLYQKSYLLNVLHPCLQSHPASNSAVTSGLWFAEESLTRIRFTHTRHVLQAKTKIKPHWDSEFHICIWQYCRHLISDNLWVVSLTQTLNIDTRLPTDDKLLYSMHPLSLHTSHACRHAHKHTSPITQIWRSHSPVKTRAYPYDFNLNLLCCLCGSVMYCYGQDRIHHTGFCLICHYSYSFWGIPSLLPYRVPWVTFSS